MKSPDTVPVSLPAAPTTKSNSRGTGPFADGEVAYHFPATRCWAAAGNAANATIIPNKKTRLFIVFFRIRFLGNRAARRVTITRRAAAPARSGHAPLIVAQI